MNDDMAMMGAPGLVPFGIMTGKANRWMVGYEFMFDQMDGSLVGTDEMSEHEILKRFPAAPTDMNMQMHMAMLMYAPTDKLTLGAMLPYIWKEMNNVTVTGDHFVEQNDGIGDLELRGSYCVYQSTDIRHRLLAHGGVGCPTGSIDATMDNMRLEYCMQVGSGTFSLLPGLTYLGQAAPWGWGADFNSNVRVGRNDNGYRLGNAYEASAWVARQVTTWASLSAGLRGEIWENVHGSDPELDTTFEQTMDPDLQDGKRLNVFVGTSLLRRDLERPAVVCSGRRSDRAISRRSPTADEWENPDRLAVGFLKLPFSGKIVYEVAPAVGFGGSFPCV